MKLTLKGARKLMAWASNDIKGDLKDLELDHDDVAGAIVLSIEEAKVLNYVQKWVQTSGYARETKKHFDFEVERLKHRIKKAEENKWTLMNTNN